VLCANIFTSVQLYAQKYIADGKMPQITITKIATIFDEKKIFMFANLKKKQKNTR